jgi:hypothetical protein
MAIKFFNIRSKEVRVAETEPQIAAMWSSSDHSPNITQGQDFGWRLAPEVVVEMKKIKQDMGMLERIAHTYNRPLEDVGEPEILQYISDQTPVDSAAVAEDGDYTDEYEQEIKRLERTDNPVPEESIEELEARLAARKAAAETTAQTATTTTTKVKK